MAHTMFELDVRLREIEPRIWRTIEVPGAASLEDVHFAIQVAMGWTNSHLHQFTIADKTYGMADVENEVEIEDERDHRLDELAKLGDTFVYEYDFGDSWTHDVTVKKVASSTKQPRPRCTAGARACPPEDCGGVGGYANLLTVLADPDHEDHGSSMEWSAGFEPERFELPKKGLDLEEEMTSLKELAESDDPFGGHDPFFDADDDGPGIDLPKPLVDAVLALDPMQRASLSALIAASLANELVEVQAAADQIVKALEARDKTTPNARKRGRS